MVPALVVTLGTANAWAQATQKPFEPQVGQAGKDVVWVPTPQTLVDKMLDMAKATEGGTTVTIRFHEPEALSA